MKALTINDPWAQLLASGLKKHETRSWSTNYRGPIAIHASKGFSAEHRRFTIGHLSRYVHQADLPYWPMWPRGAVIATAVLVDVAQVIVLDSLGNRLENQPYLPNCGDSVWLCGEKHVDPVDLALGDYATGRFAWTLENVQRIDPVPARGSLGLWDWTP